jgi:hypothetical protein
MREMLKDLLTVTNGIIVQQVNCRGVMGAGLAKHVARKWPAVVLYYSEFCKKHGKGEDLLGKIQVTHITDTLEVCNVFSQLDFGREQKLYTNYEKMHEGLEALQVYLKKRKEKTGKDLQVYFPLKFGCGLAGGDWKFVRKLIGEYFPTACICNPVQELQDRHTQAEKDRFNKKKQAIQQKDMKGRVMHVDKVMDRGAVKEQQKELEKGVYFSAKPAVITEQLKEQILEDKSKELYQ